MPPRRQPPRLRARRLAVEGAWEFSPRAFDDARGVFVSPYEREAFHSATGGHLFPVAQASHSTSRKNVIRGLHYTRTPPGCAKWVTCLHGRALDVVLDTRVGSPTFGRSDTVLLDTVSHRAVYLPVGVAHAYLALEDDTVVSYLLSAEYARENELAISPVDPALALPWPDGVAPILSERDRDAATFDEAERSGRLPDYTESRGIEKALCFG